MKNHEFDALAQDQKMNILWKEGNYIADRKIPNYTIVLYELFCFYVEVWYEDNNFNEIDILCAFSNTDQLEPYLEKIDISDVIS